MPPLIKKFPVFVIRVGSGYATISTPDSPEDAPEFGVLVFSEEKLAEDFITVAELEDAEVRFLRDSQELARVLTAQRDPTTHMALDVIFAEEGTMTLTCLPIPEVVIKHLPKARTPWDYPVYFLMTPEGNFAAILAGLPADAQPDAPRKEVTLPVLFTTFRKAKEYRKRMKKNAGTELFPVSTPAMLREAVEDMIHNDIYGVALDPTIDENGVHKTPNCLSAEKFLRTFFS